MLAHAPMRVRHLAQNGTGPRAADWGLLRELPRGARQVQPRLEPVDPGCPLRGVVSLKATPDVASLMA